MATWKQDIDWPCKRMFLKLFGAFGDFIAPVFDVYPPVLFLYIVLFVKGKKKEQGVAYISKTFTNTHTTVNKTYRVFRPLRPLNMRPCNPVSLFPVKSSSKTPPAPSNAPSRISLSLLLLRLLQAGQRKTYEESVTFIRIYNIPNLIAVINHVRSTNKSYLSYFPIFILMSSSCIIFL